MYIETGVICQFVLHCLQSTTIVDLVGMRLLVTYLSEISLIEEI